MPSIYIKNAKNKMKRHKRGERNKNKKTPDNSSDSLTEVNSDVNSSNDVSINVPSHEEAVAAAVKLANKYLNLPSSCVDAPSCEQKDVGFYEQSETGFSFVRVCEPSLCSSGE